jgi:O-antigen/teichoic acid export membrane protein
MLQLFGSLLALPFYVGCILLVDDFEIKILIGLLWVCTLIRSGEVNEFWLIGRGETGRSSIASIYSQLTSFTLKTAGVFFGAGIIYYGIVLIIDGLCKSFFFGIEIRKTGISIQKAINKIRLSKSLSYAIRRSTFLAIQSGFVIIYVQSDIVILGSIGEKNLVGIYSILTTLLAAAISLGISKSIKDYNRTKFNNDLETKVYFRETFLISFKLTIAYVIASPLVLHFLGESYSEGYRVIPIIAPLIIMSCMGSALGLTQIDENLEKESMYNTLGGAILNISLNLILIPYLGIIGSGISYTLSSFVAGYIMPRFNKSHKTKSFKHYINPFG